MSVPPPPPSGRRRLRWLWGGPIIGCAGKTSKALQAITETMSHDLASKSKTDDTAPMDPTVAFFRGDKVVLVAARDAINTPLFTGAKGTLNLKMIRGVWCNNLNSSNRKAAQATADVAIPMNQSVDESSHTDKASHPCLTAR